MTVLRRLQKLFLYAGVEKEEYRGLIPRIREENLVLLKVFSQISAVMFFLLLIASMNTSGFASVNSPTYLVSGLAMLLILFCSIHLLPKHPELVMPTVYLFEIIFYAFGIHISMLHAEKPAVSAVAFLLVSPLLFYDRPLRLSSLIAAVVALFCGIAVRYKTPDAAESDVWNMITFGIVAVSITVFSMSIKIRALSQSRQITYMSQTDLLTGVKNRNYYENWLQSYPGICTKNLICVYADVNDLHDINNSSGHAEGDRVLREAAKALQQCFGPDHTYRIGGDEFVAFRVDGAPEDLPADIARMKKYLREKRCSVSFGNAVQDKTPEGPDMIKLVNDAEADMYADKREFYLKSENDRRS